MSALQKAVMMVSPSRLVAVLALLLAPQVGTAGTVAGGLNHTVLIRPSDSALWAAGSNTRGQLGTNNQTSTSEFVPVTVPAGLDGAFTAVAAGNFMSVGLTSGGSVWAWGDRATGVTGDGITTGYQLVPKKVPNLTGVIGIAAGADHVLAWTSSGRLWVWGLNSTAGKLGLAGSPPPAAQLTPVMLPDSGPNSLPGQVVFASASAFHSAVVLTNGKAYAFGAGSYGQLANGATADSPVPVEISLPSGVSAVSIEAGSRHTVILANTASASGVAYVAGSNGFSQLALGATPAQTATPIEIPNLSGITAASVGTHHTVLLDGQGRARTFGLGSSGQIGQGTTSNQNTPYLLPEPTGVSAIGTGDTNTFLITTANAVWAFGSNSSSQLADGTTTQRNSPTMVGVMGATAWKVPAPQFNPPPGISAGPQTITLSCSTAACTIRYSTTTTPTCSTGSVYTTPLTVTSSTTISAIGCKTGWTASSVTSARYQIALGTLAAPTFSEAAGAEFSPPKTITLTAAAGAEIWYRTDGGEPTAAAPSLRYTAPIELAAPSTTINAKAFQDSYYPSPTASRQFYLRVATPALSPAGGSYPVNQAVSITSATANAAIHYTIDGSEPTQSSPAIVSGKSVLLLAGYTLKVKAWKAGANPSQVATGVYTVTGQPVSRLISAGSSSFVVTPSKTAYGFGLNDFQQIGSGSTGPKLTPVPVVGLSDVVGLASGNRHTLALLVDGSIRSWGVNTDAQLADATVINAPTPVRSLVDNVVQVAAGNLHSLFVKADGSLWTVGNNASKQLGQAGSSPAGLVALPAPVLSVAGGQAHSVILLADGRLYSVGDNSFGALGNGTYTNPEAYAPALINVSLDPGVTLTAVAAGGQTTMLLDSQGNVWTVGRGTSGQLGLGTTSNRNTAARIAPALLTGVTALAAGSKHGLALKQGSVYAWGHGAFGALGNGQTGNQTTPVQVLTAPGVPLTGIAQIAAGQDHSLAISDQGVLYSWGIGTAGQSGDGSGVNRLYATRLTDPGVVLKAQPVNASPVGSLYQSAQTVTLTTTTPDAVVRYTTNGQEPTEASPPASPAGPVTVPIGGATALKARAFRTGWGASEVTTNVYSFNLGTLAQPGFDPPGGTITTNQQVTLTSNAGVTVLYSTDGSEPTTPYVQPLTLSANTTLKAKATHPDWTPSSVRTEVYSLRVTTPVFSPSTGAAPVRVTTATAGATIHYTLTGATPTAGDPVVASGGYVHFSQVATLKAIAIKAGLADSAVAAAVFNEPTATVAAPVLSPLGGVYATGPALSAMSATPNATIRYTDDGTDPDESSDVLPAGHRVDASAVIKVRAFATGLPPSPVVRADYRIVGAASTGYEFTIFLKGDGTAWLAGQQTCAGTTHSYGASPVQVAGFPRIKAVSAGYSYSLLLAEDGSVWSQGCNDHGQLADPSNTGPFREAAAQIAGISGATHIAAGAYIGAAVVGVSDPAAGGSVVAWGYNGHSAADGKGHLGTGVPASTQKITAPTAVLNVTGVTGLHASAFAQHFLATTASEEVWSWGMNHEGQSGQAVNPLYAAKAIPSLLPGIDDIIEAAAGEDHSMLLTKQGNVLTFGHNTNGYAELGTTSGGGPTPAQVPNLSNVVSVAAGSHNSFAVRNDGSLLSWGRNGAGLGNGRQDYSSPMGLARSLSVGEPFTVIRVSAAYYHVVAVADLGYWSWGYTHNSPGVLGRTLATSVNPWAEPLTAFHPADDVWLRSDTDADDLAAHQEYRAATDPLNWDTNGDGRSDGASIGVGIDPNIADADGDGLTNTAEAAAGTDPFRADTDGDGVIDGSDAFPLDPTMSTAPTNPSDRTPPTITLLEPTNAQAIQ